MIASVAAGVRRRLSDRSERIFVVGVGAITVIGLWCRVAGLTRGSLYRDDAWVALTSRVPWHDAWRMVGTAPGFVLFERFWVGLTAPSTWWAQIPTLVVSVAAIPLMALLARWWGLSRFSALLATTLIAVGTINVTYATHLKPYAHDLVAGMLILAAAEWWRRGKSAWPFAILSVICLAVSFSVAPVVIGCGVVLGVTGLRTHRAASLVGPALVVIIPFGALYWRVRGGISPRLTQSWAPNFVHFNSLHAFVHSSITIVDGLIWGFIDTTPHWHVPGLSKLVIAFVIVTAIVGACRQPLTVLPTASVIAAVLFATLHVAPLGTGRTDAYLYSSLALLVCVGVDTILDATRRRQVVVARVAVAIVVALAGFLVLDRTFHRPRYPGGDIAPVALAVHATVQRGGGVIIEGTARWPWTYYEVHPVRLRFSPAYNTGFAPLSDDPRIYVMPGTVIEGGYDPVAAVRAVSAHDLVLYVRTDDWPTLGDPLRATFHAFCYHEVRHAHPTGYLLEWFERTSSSCPGLPRDTATTASSTPRP